MELVKEFANKKTITAVICFVLAIIFFASLPYFQKQVDDLTYTTLVNEVGEPHYTEEYDEGEEFRVYDDQIEYDALSGEISIRQGIGFGLLFSTGLLALLGAYEIYRNRQLTEAANNRRNKVQ